MKVGRVVGTVVSTINHSFFDGERLLICDILDRDQPAGDYLICTNVVDAGTGDTVLILDEGTSARQMYGIDTGPIRSVVVGIVDDVHEQVDAD
jgi:ethanolamine utilization protein EutN